MFVSILRSNRRILSRGAALLLLGGISAGCSSQVARFNGPDDIFTGSTANQRQIIAGDQTYPGDAAPLRPAMTSSVSRGTLSPVTVQPLPPPASPAPVRTAVVESPRIEKPTRLAPAERPLAPPKAPAAASLEKPAEVPTKAPAKPPAIAAASAGGTVVTVQEGNTLLGIAHKYGVSASDLMKANGITDSSGLKFGQKITIPGPSQKAAAVAAGAPMAAKVAVAKPIKTDAPAKAPATPSEKVAVLPQSAKVKEQAVAATETTATPKPKAVASTEKPAAGGYTVKSGDTLSKIAKKTGVSVAALKAANGDGNLKVGQAIKVPAGGSIVAAGEKVDQVKTAAVSPAPKKATEQTVTEYTPPKKDDKVIEQAEASPEKAPDSTGIDRMRWPVKGRVITAFGKGSGKANDGIDIAVPEGTAVKAAENGVVIYAGDGLKEFGNTVLVRHDNGLVTVYGNAKELKVQRGQKVRRGDEVALSGMSGDATTPKLHFEVRKNSAPVDPSTFLE